MKKIYFFSLLFLLQISVYSQAFEWEWQNGKPTGNDYMDVYGLNNGRVVLFGDASSVIISTNEGETWKVTYADNQRRSLWNAYFLNSTTGFICGEGGLIMKTTDGGESWTEKPSGSTNILYDIEFLNADTGIAVGAAGTVLRTFDGGNTWSAGTVAGTGSAYKVAIVNKNNIYIGSATSTARLQKSTDFGTTWTIVTPAGVTSSVYGMFIKDASTYFLATGSNGLLSTTDAGTTWTVKQATANIVYDVRFVNSSLGFATDSKGIVYKSTDGGSTWASTPTTSNKALRAIGYNAAAIYTVGNAGNIFKSIDNGATWTAKHTSVAQDWIRKMKFNSSSVGYASGGSSTAADSLGYMLTTSDGGFNWTKMAYNFKAQVYSFSMPTATTWYAGRTANGLFKSTDGGVTYTKLTTPITSTTHIFNFVNFTTDQTGIAGGSSGKVIKTTDGGATWTDLSTAAGFGSNSIYEAVVIDASTFYLAGGGGRFVKTTDGGTSFTALTMPIAGTFFTARFKNANFGVVAGYSSPTPQAAFTTNGGATWTASTLPDIGTSSLWAVAFSDSGYIWLSSINGHMLYSTDGGLNYVNGKRATTNSIFSLDVVGNNLWAAGASSVIFKGGSSPYLPVELTSFTAEAVNKSVILKWSTASESNNKGFEIQKQISGSWSKIGYVDGTGTTVNKSSYSFTDNNASANNIYRLKQVDFDGTFSYSGIVEFNFTAPLKFELAQNYPNPFNPNTSINYSIPAKSNVELKIYNVLGKEVASLVNEVKEAGYYNVNFNASNLASGVYFYKINAGQFNSVRKMLLLK